MTQPRRFVPPAFNPEKFLAKEHKKLSGPSKPPQALFIPIAFSKERIEALIARVAAEAPGAFALAPTHLQRRSFSRLWKTEIAKELTVYGLPCDPILIEYLLAGLLTHPLFKKRARKKL